jgi:1-acyl-sn-glycerol-3-phosphate acyltransferase
MIRSLRIFHPARSLWRLFLLLGTSIQAGLAFAVRRARGPVALAERAEWLHTRCKTAMERLGITVTVEGRFPRRGLLVCNHLSYVDILGLSACSACVFVAKKDVRSWPLYGRLASMAGTVFVDRNRRFDASRANRRISEALAAGLVVVLFPEGTSSDGSTVLPFRAALFEPAIRDRQPISAAHISYSTEDGSVERDVCYWGTMSFLPHLLRFLRVRKLSIRFRFTPAFPRFEDRKQAAMTTRQAILQLSQPSRSDRLGAGGRTVGTYPGF